MEAIGYILVLIFALLNIGESVVVKAYANRYQSGGMIMNAVIALFSFSFFVITDIVQTDGFYFPSEMIPMGLVNCVLYAVGFYSAFLAFKVGPYGLTRLISNFSLLFTVFYGIIVLDEPRTGFTYAGIVLIFAALFLMNYTGNKEKAEEGKISLKWIVYIAVTVVSNGFISILGRVQQIKFENACTNEFLMISIGGSFVLLAIIGLIIDRDKLKSVLTHGTLYGLGAGLCNGAKNFVSLLVFLFVPMSTVSPMKIGVGIALTFVVSKIFYKEKYSVFQIIGVISGAVAVVMLSV
ncbi:MAG: hypothetical protein IKB38_00635 [Clostridia bacterium]|nr:hypothetical protein [Clostridia bacterium]